MQRATAVVSSITVLAAGFRRSWPRDIRLVYGAVEVRHLVTALAERQYNPGLVTAVPLVVGGIVEVRRKRPVPGEAKELATLGFTALLVSHVVATVWGKLRD